MCNLYLSENFLHIITGKPLRQRRPSQHYHHNFFDPDYSRYWPTRNTPKTISLPNSHNAIFNAGIHIQP
ncbi:hypothetical protein EYC80_006237 [Monilinia laxa]|uniref:Uncharacterized protein n=1 Tax=Monilinia laxa TaxID=61186 RepID=A0A5N6KGL7_MONLA|nr:hypothetical protein EYC80_006237 [Monilinia laxa]